MMLHISLSVFVLCINLFVVLAQNLRIQVNNDNLQQPPYLLELANNTKLESNNAVSTIIDNQTKVYDLKQTDSEQDKAIITKSNHIKNPDLNHNQNNDQSNTKLELELPVGLEFSEQPPDNTLESSSRSENFFALTDDDSDLLNAFFEPSVRDFVQPNNHNNNHNHKPIFSLPLMGQVSKKPYTAPPSSPLLQSATDIQESLFPSALSNNNIKDKSMLDDKTSSEKNSHSSTDLDEARIEREKVGSHTLKQELSSIATTQELKVEPTIETDKDNFKVISKNFNRNKVTSNVFMDQQKSTYERDKKESIVSQQPCLSNQVDKTSDYSNSNKVQQQQKQNSNFINNNLDAAPNRLIVDDAIIEDLKIQRNKSEKKNSTHASTMNTGAKTRPTVTSTDVDSRCQGVENYSTFEHTHACDKYYQCENGLYIEHVCPNGLMYGIRDIVRDSCVHRWNANCGDKSVPNPISSPGCRWQNGIFNVEDSPRCSPDYYECIDGKFYVRRCETEGHMYDERSKSCRWAEGMGCVTDILGFTCPPNDKENIYWPFPRYFLNNNAFITCINDKPRVFRCGEHERVHVEELYCVSTI